MDRGELVWSPPEDALVTSRIGAYMRWLADHRQLRFRDYHDLWRWSVDDLDAFWSSFAEWIGVRWHSEPVATLGRRDMPGTEWFPGATLNWAEHALALADTRPDDVAVLARGQTRPPAELTWAELREAVTRCRAGLRRLGVGRGDRVCAYSPNIPETLIAFIATASLGAIWSSCAPEFGSRAVIDRFSQIDPTVLIAIDGYRYGAKDIDRTDEVRAIEAGLPTLTHTVRIRYLGTGDDTWSDLLDQELRTNPSAAPDSPAGAAPPHPIVARLPGGRSADQDVRTSPSARPGPISYEPVPFDHPLWVVYSSGTTGLPKAIVHGHGGITLEQMKTHALHHDVSPGDRFGWFTTTGWVMWNYLVSSLLVGGSIWLFDGDPAYPDLSTLWHLAADDDLDVFGVSAPFVMASRKAGVGPPPNRLRSLASTGSPLPGDGFRWIRDVLGERVQPSSVSGGTDVCCAFVGTAPIVPVRAGEISCRMLGVAADAYDPDGQPCPAGVTGELVITAPMPSMPVAFWGDADGSKLRAAYYSDYPGVWRHGDWITFADDGACVLSGRSDATLNRGGVRLGTSDFYAVVEELPGVADSLVVHLEGDADDPMGRLILFVAPAPGAAVDAELVGALRSALRTQLSPRHLPDAVLAVPAVPRTLSGKKLEVPVKRILGGAAPASVASRSSLADPSALDWFAANAGEILRVVG